MTDFTQQRINMVDSQVRPSDVTDRRIIRAMLYVPRESFAPEAMHDMAYMDEALPVTHAKNGAPVRALLAPRTLAKIVQLAELGPESVVLDVGCGTGYSTAVLAAIAGRVVALESDAGLADLASATLGRIGVVNAKVMKGGLPAGAPDEAPFDAILLNGSVSEVPQSLLDQLKDGGRLVAVVANGAYGRAMVWTRTGRTYSSRAAFDASADPLPGFERQPGFVF